MDNMGKGDGAVATTESLASGREPPARGQVMDRLREFLDSVREHGQAVGNFLGLLHVLIGRKITLDDGTIVSTGQTWREVAGLLKRVRWEREAVAELGLDPDTLPPRDRQLFWFKAIAQAQVDSLEARAAGDRLVVAMKDSGFLIGSAPG
jgi:hypothetical protein